MCTASPTIKLIKHCREGFRIKHYFCLCKIEGGKILKSNPEELIPCVQSKFKVLEFTFYNIEMVICLVRKEASMV